MPATLSPAATPRRITLTGVSWEFYQSMLAEVAESHIRLTFDGGRLEIMSPLPIHEHVKKVLARIIETYAEEMDIDAEGFGSTTFDREDLQKGLEPDECYYIQHAAEVIGRHEFDWEVDPPPDLAIEVDISRPDVARQPIYAALGVSEIWKFDGKGFVFLLRQQQGRDAQYVESALSAAFPRLSAMQVNQFLEIGLGEGQKAAVKAVRNWCAAEGS